MKRQSHLKLVELRLAQTSVGASTLRGQVAGTVAAARNYLKTIRIGELTKPQSFPRQLDSHTSRLDESFPSTVSCWGGARKCINIFLRDALYNQYTSAAYDLDAVEHLLEVPLDSTVANSLKRDSDGAHLPKWPGLSRLTPEINTAYQEVAESIAEDMDTIRVHLDLVFFKKYG